MKYTYKYTICLLLGIWNNFGIKSQEQHINISETISLPHNTIEGKLTNGLQYIILPNSSPSHTTEFRLIMHLGSLQESDEQLGAAHFLEHMAFAGTKNFPERSMIEYFESLGMKYGRDINAVTGYDRTIYMLTVPMDNDDRDIADTTLLAMKDWLTGITFDEKRTRKERGVILEELRGYDVGDPFYSLKIGQNRFTSRMPLGTAKDISCIDREKLREFYHQWYTPQLATIVVVGCIDPLYMEKRIRELFGNISGNSGKGYCHYPLEYNEGIKIHEIKDSLKRNSEMEVIIPHPGITGIGLTDIYHKEQGRLLVKLINKRLSLRKIPATVSDSWYLSDKNHFVISISEKNKSGLLSVLTRICGELNYIIEEGFCPNELENAIADLIESLDHPSGNQTSAQWCEDFTDYVLSGERYIHNADEMKALKERIGHTTSEELQNILSDWTEYRKRHILVAYKNNSGKEDFITENEIEKSWEEGMNLPVESFEFHPESHDILKAGTPICLSAAHRFSAEYIAEEKSYPELKTDEIILKNGIKILLRPTNDKQETLYLTAFARGGTSDLSPECYHRLEGTAGYMEMGGIEAVDSDSLSAYLSQEEISLNISISSHWHEMMAMAPVNRSLELFNLMFEKMHSPELRYADFEEIRKEELEKFGKESLLEQMMKRSPDHMLDNRLDSLTGNIHDQKFPTRSRRDVEQMNLDEIAEYYKSLFTNPSGLTIIVSGNFHTEVIKRQLISTFGRMHSPKGAKMYTNTRFCIPEHSYIEEFPNDNENQTLLEYVFAGNYHPSLAETLKLKIARDIIQSRLLQVLREQHNIVYSPYISLFYHGIPQQTYYFNISVSVNTDNTELTEGLILEIISELQNRPVDNEELENIKRSFLVTKRQVLSDDAPTEWRNILAGQLKNGESLDDFEKYTSCLNAITTEQLQQAFIRYLDTKKFVLLYRGKHQKYNTKTR